MEYVADRAETTSTVWLGLTVGCARCHDHKYDPITQKEFYRLFAYFNNVPDEKGFVCNYGNEEPLRQGAAARAAAEAGRARPAGGGGASALRRAAAAVARRTARMGTLAPRARATGSEKAGFRSDGDDEARVATPARAMRVADGPGAQHFDGKHYLEGDGKIANFDYHGPVHVGGVDPAGVAERRDPLARRGLFRRPGARALPDRRQDPRCTCIRRWTDLGMRVETAEPVTLNEWQHVLVTYDGKRKAAGVHIYVNGEPAADEGSVRPEH